MSKAKLERGLKWFTIKRKAEFEQDGKQIDWLASQKSIVEDIEFYKLSLPKATPKSKGK